MLFDVAIIGAGVSGAFIARELSRYNLKVALLEKCNDVAMGSTKANSAIVHAGYDAEPGTVKAKMNIRGIALMAKVCAELNAPFKNIGSLVVAYNNEEYRTLEELYDRGVTNGVPNMRIISRDELIKREPHISPSAIAALHAPTASIVCPYELAIAAAENAVENGAVFKRNHRVCGITFENDVFTIHTTEEGDVQAKYVVNAAGTFADQIAKMIGDDSFNIIARKGEYFLLDKIEGEVANHVLFPCPSKMGKGILISPTVDGNILMGPTALDIADKDDIDTTADGLEMLKQKSVITIPSLTTRRAVTSFAGIRAHTDREENDFIIGPSEKNGKFINVAGIESPGLTSAPAIGEYVCKMLVELTGATPNKNFNPHRKAPIRFREMSIEERKELIAKDKRYGRIICRCETVTEGEIMDAIHSTIGAVDMDGVKRRTRAGMGRCQSGFCGSKVVEILARELNVPQNTITKNGGESNIIYERTK